MKKQTTFALLLAAAPLAWSGEAPRGLEAELQACAGITEGVARLDCYDRLARTRRPQVAATAPPPARAAAPAPASAPAPAPAPAPAAVVPPAAPSVRGNAPAPDSAAFAQEQLKPRDAPDRESAQAALQARIATTRKGAGGLYFVTLDNGQVWRHEDGAMADYMKAGEAVTISRASLGSYRMTLDAQNAKNWVRVTRVR